jgi:fucose permease
MTARAPAVSPRAVFAACCSSSGLMGVVSTAPALCLTAIAADLGLGPAGSGVYLSGIYWGLTVSLLVTGPFADRFGFRIPFVASAVLQAAGMLLTAAASTPWMATAGAVVVGLGIGALDALVTPLVCAVYPEARTRTSNLLHAFYPLGMLLSVFLVLLLLRLGLDWHGVYRWLSLLCLPYGLMMLLIGLPATSHAGPERLPTRDLIGTRHFLVLAVLILLAGATEAGPSQWLPAYIEKAAGGTQFGGALGLLAFGTTMACGRLGNSLLAHRFGATRLVTGGAIVCTAMIVLAALPVPALVNVAALATIGLAVSGLWPSVLALAGDRFPAAGASMFSLLSSAGGMGCVIGPLAIGLVADRWGLRWGMAALTVAPLGVVLFQRAFALDRPAAPAGAPGA